MCLRPPRILIFPMTSPARMFIEIVWERKEAHHGLASLTVDRGAAAYRQRGTVLSSQPTHPGKDARALAVAQRGQAPGRGQDRGCKSCHHPAVRGCVSRGGLARLRQWNPNRPVSEMAAYRDLIRESFEKQPARTVAEAGERIFQLTGLRRSPSQVRKFVKD